MKLEIRNLEKIFRTDTVETVALNNVSFTINDGERICQMVITRYTRVTWEPVNRIDRTERGDGAFGHTGVN